MLKTRKPRLDEDQIEARYWKITDTGPASRALRVTVLR
jgi:hypothetical protein